MDERDVCIVASDDVLCYRACILVWVRAYIKTGSWDFRVFRGAYGMFLSFLSICS
jgi:hypothetical protein